MQLTRLILLMKYDLSLQAVNVIHPKHIREWFYPAYLKNERVLSNQQSLFCVYHITCWLQCILHGRKLGIDFNHRNKLRSELSFFYVEHDRSSFFLRLALKVYDPFTHSAMSTIAQVNQMYSYSSREFTKQTKENWTVEHRKCVYSKSL